MGDVETEEGEEEVDLCTMMDEEASNLYQDLLGERESVVYWYSI